MLTFFEPERRFRADVLAYRREILRNSDSFDGTAGLGSFESVDEWFERIELLASEKAERCGWYRTLVQLAYDGGALCGLVNLRLSDSAEVERLAGHIGYHVRPSLRRRGYGRALLCFAGELARQNGVTEPTVCTAADNLPSQKTALSAGFLPNGCAILPNGETVLRFRLKST